ncbi:APC family permease [Francisella sp. SYW-9]|uniref:APC family permease n=1 Tax=Francisella sp. SYW-9 TaxID=2610888 RepID=UPI00123E0506|nr:APC family permease [Francisella sp. SYW-9]
MEQIKEQKNVGLFTIIFISVSGIIGSGWLFSSYLGAKQAGSGVYFSWIIVLVFFLLMGLAVSEVAVAYPVRGIVGRMGSISHNKYFGALFSFAIWLELVGSMPGEAQASVQYLSHLSPSISNILMSKGDLSAAGLGLTFIFLIFYWLINMIGMEIFKKCNNTIAVLKIIIPIYVCIVIMGAHFDSGNFTAYHNQISPYGINSILMAVTSAGMVYAFNGFQLATSFAGEIKKPHINIPLGIIISIVLCFAIFILLQTAFIGSLDRHQLITKGWLSLNFNSPFVQVATLLGLNIVALILYADAVMSPSGTGITFVGTASRVLFGMSKEKIVPGFFAKLHPRFQVSYRAMIFNFLLTLIFLFCFRSWGAIVLIITALIVLMYMVIPISLVAMRNSPQEIERKFKMPLAKPICYLLFVVQTIFFAFIGSKDMTYLTIVITLLMIVFIFFNIKNNKSVEPKYILKCTLPFLAFLWLVLINISLGPVAYEGCGIFNYYIFFIIHIALAIIFFYLVTNKKFVLFCQKHSQYNN